MKQLDGHAGATKPHPQDGQGGRENDVDALVELIAGCKKVWTDRLQYWRGYGHLENEHDRHCQDEACRERRLTSEQ